MSTAVRAMPITTIRPMDDTRQELEPVTMVHGKRDGFRRQLAKHRSSLTLSEFAFLEALADDGDDDDVAAASEQLNNDKLFFDSESEKAKKGQRGRPGLTRSSGSVMGSLRRIQCLENRRSSATQVSMWKSASRRNLVVEEDNESIDQPQAEGKFGRRGRPSVAGRLQIQAISEDASFDSKDFEDTDDDLSDDEKKEQEIEKERKIFKPMMTKRASVNAYGGEGFEVGDSEIFAKMAAAKAAAEEEAARKAAKEAEQYNPWTAAGEDFAGIEFDFKVIGTSAEDQSAQPHVLSPPLMHSLQEVLPFSKRGESFWLKYSLVRDGASSSTFLQQLRGATHCVMAMETVDGEVFGAYTGAPWHIEHNTFGTGDTFVWKMKSTRAQSAKNVLEQAKRESEIDVFKYSYENNAAQTCQHDRIAVGGGTTSHHRDIGGATIKPHEWGFALAFEGDYLLETSTSPCITFNSPSLSEIHSDGSLVELVNLEVWVLTPCLSVQEATKMELKKLFLQKHSDIL